MGAAGTAQQEPSNTNEPVRVLSPGDSGAVSQSNEASSDASAGNLNATGQSANQTQSGDGLQVIGQSAQERPGRGCARVHRPAGCLERERARPRAEPGGEWTGHAVERRFVGRGGRKPQRDRADGRPGTGRRRRLQCCGGGDQVIGQAADNKQEAGALAATVQEKPSNENISVRVLSPGNDGPVTQSNSASSDATAANLNGTKQTAEQNQAGGGGSQTIGQAADNEQNAGALAATIQEKPSNTNVNVRVLSPGSTARSRSRTTRRRTPRLRT